MPYKETKIEKLFYTISEVAENLGENTSLVRFWANSFPDIIKPSRNKKGNRMFTAKDLANFRTIHHLVKVKGVTLDGVRGMFKNGREGGDNTAELVARLSSIREMLVNVRESLDK